MKQYKKLIPLLVVVALVLGVVNTYFIFSNNRAINVDAVKTYCRALADGKNKALWSESTQESWVALDLSLLDPQNFISTTEVFARRSDIREDVYIDCLQEKLK